VFSGGIAPFVATLLFARYGSGAVASYMVACCVVSLVAAWFLPETHRANLDSIVPSPATTSVKIPLAAAASPDRR
jgi:hypothetical protein